MVFNRPLPWHFARTQKSPTRNFTALHGRIIEQQKQGKTIPPYRSQSSDPCAGRSLRSKSTQIFGIDPLIEAASRSPDNIPWQLHQTSSHSALNGYALEEAQIGHSEISAIPKLGSAKMARDMAEIYAIALLRDMSFRDIDAGAGIAGKLAEAFAQVPEQIPQRLQSAPIGLCRAPLPEHSERPYLSGFWQVATQTNALLGRNDLFCSHPLCAKAPATPNDLAQVLARCSPVQLFARSFDSLIEHGARPVPLLDPVGSRPHLMAILQQGALRASKAVQRRRFSPHLRARPQALARITTLIANGMIGDLGPVAGAAEQHLVRLERIKVPGFRLLEHVHDMNRLSHGTGYAAFAGLNYLVPLPDALPSSPMRRWAYVTIAGCCATLLKALVDMSGNRDTALPMPCLQIPQPAGAPVLTLQGELNKLAANFALGPVLSAARYVSEARDDLRMGERVAIGLLFEKMLETGRTLDLTFDDFEGARICLSSTGSGKASLSIDGTSNPVDLETWWTGYRA